MSKLKRSVSFSDTEHGRQRGQILVLFTLALVAMIAMVGLILDGGGAYAQRRGEQNAADLAALAGANDYLLNNNSASAIARAQAVAAQNGYKDGAGGVTVGVSIDTSNGASVTVNIGAPHQNNFASIVGMSTWNVATTATALTGFPDTASGAAPFIFSVDAFGTNGQPLATYGNPSIPFGFGGCGDAPQAATDFAWTNYGTGNVDTNQVRSIINGSLVIDRTIEFGTYIGQHNQGCHTALYSDVQTYDVGLNLPVPIVDHNGNFQGWATFHVTSASGGSSKVINGYFVSPFVSQLLTVGGCAAGSCPRYLGSYVLKLTN
ncbi:MAG: pilus assembly protein TadG-related protein [Candidatus Limnocylindrales bacterium]